MRRVTVDPRKILRARIVPWEDEEFLYGIAYELADGAEGMDLIGRREDTQEELRRISAIKGMARKAPLEPHYWFVGFADAPWRFYRDEDRMTEAEWRAEAPHDGIALLDHDRRKYGGE